ncbi:class I mannose-6-phosphate isomerase [Niabella drilacis]|uniref:Mannose-6-phosphate isomerase, class I n=1 Tax=Niabella drilacis (strain DSM 25811 / CCM 8410 / CCUG 62505 / LMG 26954 / E90) TaxID=1285928 RepID=A0A1G6X2X4_NIADE|nr:class I mannose-6-phosphate isomerase [Niabella drilacis]SDD72384.1 Mannose-6-phosphate isomerase, class I [Niabella drilacis]
MSKRNYDKKPCIRVSGQAFEGWDAILNRIRKDPGSGKIVVVDCYTGICYEELLTQLKTLPHSLLVLTPHLFRDEDAILAMTKPFVTDDPLFGYMTKLRIADYFDTEKLQVAREQITRHEGTVLVLGCGAGAVVEGDLVIYADMPRWELQQRMRKKTVQGLGVSDGDKPFATQYKRGLFNDWKVLDQHKQTLYDKVHYWLDTTNAGAPVLIDRNTFLSGMAKAAGSPFRVVPFFDPAPWGGQWMKEAFGLDPDAVNYGWCFDCVPEENSLLFCINETLFETPAINLVFIQSKALLGERVLARFGKEFPIRFDFLDTMDGGNLSLQVHPTRAFAQEHFGIAYTQDESYYLLDAKEDAFVYLGMKTGADPGQMLQELDAAQSGSGRPFDADRYVNKIPAKKHDHFLIPAGTVHCSGKDAMVLEISATPFLYTFKLWDWDRLGLDGLPRPINISRGREVINAEADAGFAARELINRFEVVQAGKGWVQERTGLHESQFIETFRHTFQTAVVHYTNGSVNVLNLVEGDAVIVEGLQHEFEPLVVHYAETFIIPAAVTAYSVRPYGAGPGATCVTMKACIKEA